MPDNPRGVLAEMDAWIGNCGEQQSGPMSKADAVEWRDGLAAALDRLEKMEQVAQSAIDAYLMRPSPAALPTTSPTRTSRAARQRVVNRLANAMAALERELASARGEKILPPQPEPPRGTGA